MLDFDIEWLQAPSVGNAELRETWARLCVKIDGALPCAVLDSASGSVRTSLYLSVYPLAEWFSYHWWSLFYESYSSSRGTRQDYHFRHSLLGAAEGFALPDLAFYPLGDFIQLLWRPRSVQHAALRFLDEGQACMERGLAMERVGAFIDTVVARLEARDIRDTALQTEWSAIRALNAEERYFCETSARLGVDPFDPPDGLEADLLNLHEMLAPSAFQELLSAAPVGEVVYAAQVIHRFKGKKAPLDLSALRLPLSRIAKTDWKRPWEIGYDFARKLRKALKLREEPFPDDTALAHALVGSAHPLYSDLPLRAKPTLSGITRFSKDGEASFGVAARLASNRRFTFCRALFPCLLQNARQDGTHLVTSGYTAFQQAGRAFAAEFLAPRSAVSEKLGVLKDEHDRVDEVAKVFGVSSFVIGHQNENARRQSGAPAFAF